MPRVLAPDACSEQGNVLPALTACYLHLHVVNTENAIHIMASVAAHLDGEVSTA